MTKKVFVSAFLAGAIYVAVLYSRQEESRKRFIRHLAGQIRYLPGRYFA